MLYLKGNVPVWERGLRVAGVAGAGMAVVFARYPLGMWIGVAGSLIFALTGLVGYCPMCAMVGRKPVEAGMIRAEAVLVEAACGGDSAAVEKLLGVCQPGLRRFARRLSSCYLVSGRVEA